MFNDTDNPEITKELKKFVVIGHHKENQIAAYMDTFDTIEEANTYIGIESMQMESEGVTMLVYRLVED